MAQAHRKDYAPASLALLLVHNPGIGERRLSSGTRLAGELRQCLLRNDAASRSGGRGQSNHAPCAAVQDGVA